MGSQRIGHSWSMHKVIKKITFFAYLKSWGCLYPYISLWNMLLPWAGHMGGCCYIRVLLGRPHRKKFLGLNIGSIFFLWATGLFLVWETVTEWMPLLIFAAWKHAVSSEPHLPFAVGRASQHPFNQLQSACWLFLLPVSFCAMPLLTLSLAGLSGTRSLRQNLRFRIFIKVYPWNQHLREEVEKNQDWGGGKAELWCSPSDSLSWPQGGPWR